MIFRKLSEVAPPSPSRVRPAPDDIVWHLTLDQIESGSGRITRRAYGRAAEAASSTFVFDDGNVLYSKLRPYLNKVICPDSTGIATTELVPLRPNTDELNREYLCFYLRSPEFVAWASAQVDGAKMPRMKMNSFWAFEIPLPSLDNQIRIAYLLGKVERLIAQRKQHMQQLDDLLKSVFLEMFGDPVRNEMGWEKKQFSDLLVDIESGKSPKCEARPATADEWGVLKLGAVTGCSYKEGENKALPEGVTPSVQDEVRTGDLLFSRKNTYELVAACAYVFNTRPRLLMPDLIFRFVFREDAEINPIYVWKLLSAESQRKVIQSLAAGAAGSMPNISKGNLKRVQLPIPPLPLQEEFSAIVERVESLKSRYQKSLTNLEALYAAVSQKAFKGELDLSRVPLPDAAPPEPAPAAPNDAAPLATMPQAIDLPDTDLLPQALESRERLQLLLRFWLDAYHSQLAGAPFSAQAFLTAAQTRLAELHPDDDFELGAEDYEQIKTWVFEALADGRLTQGYSDTDNRVTLASQAPDWGTW